MPFQLTTLQFVRIVNFLYSSSSSSFLKELETFLKDPPLQTNYILENQTCSFGTRSLFCFITDFRASQVSLEQHTRVEGLVQECTLVLSDAQAKKLAEWIL